MAVILDSGGQQGSTGQTHVAPTSRLLRAVTETAAVFFTGWWQQTDALGAVPRVLLWWV